MKCARNEGTGRQATHRLRQALRRTCNDEHSHRIGPGSLVQAEITPILDEFFQVALLGPLGESEVAIMTAAGIRQLFPVAQPERT